MGHDKSRNEHVCGKSMLWMLQPSLLHDRTVASDHGTKCQLLLLFRLLPCTCLPTITSAMHRLLQFSVFAREMVGCGFMVAFFALPPASAAAHDKNA